MYLLDMIVKQLIEEHEGGEVFFNYLDKAVQERPFTDALISLVNKVLEEKNLINKSINVVVSGKFGRYFSNYYQPVGDFNVFAVNGGLRRGEPIDDIFKMIDVIGADFIFLDDSFYSGKTRDVIEDELEKNGARLLHTFVIYDGSREKDATVHSLYRYYDNFN